VPERMAVSITSEPHIPTQCPKLPSNPLTNSAPYKPSGISSHANYLA
jgi:hypothetical protein